MSDYLKRRERERKLEKIRGKVKGNGNGGGRAKAAPRLPAGVRPAMREHAAALERGHGVLAVLEVAQGDLPNISKAWRTGPTKGGALFADYQEKKTLRELERAGLATITFTVATDADAHRVRGNIGDLYGLPTAAGRRAHGVRSPESTSAPTAPDEDEDHHGTAENLVLYIQNTAELVVDVQAIRRNLITHWARGNYNRDGAVKSFKRLADTGAKRYMREFPDAPGKGFGPFTPAIRKQAAVDLAEWYEAEADLGNFDYLLPPRYGHKVRRA